MSKVIPVFHTPTRVSEKGQVTIPLEVRKALGIQRGDRIVFELTGNGQATLRRARTWVEEFAGKVPPRDPPLSSEEERLAFERGVGAEVSGIPLDE
jgi:AbrB family looped-hinge helix DNA binding protein